MYKTYGYCFVINHTGSSMFETLLTITKGTHFFKLSTISPRVRPIVVEFAKRFIRYQFVRVGRNFQRKPHMIFCTATADKAEYRFHINQLEQFEDYLTRYRIDQSHIKRVVLDVNPGLKMAIDVKPGWVERDDQVGYIDYFVNDQGPVSRLLPLQTGKGKTFCSLKAVSKIGKRFVAILRPAYLKKWEGDVHKILDIDKDSVVSIRGGDQLKSLLLMAENDLLGDIKAILVSNKTYQLWLKAYEQHRSESLHLGYAFEPDMFFDKLDAGVRLIDEVHQDLHLQFKTDLYTNVWRSIALSATFFSKDTFTKMIQEIMYPIPNRAKVAELDKYIASCAVFYRIRDIKLIRTTEPGNINYSHNAFERSIIKNNKLLDSYLKILKFNVEKFFMCDYAQGQKCIVFASSIEMCTIMADFLQRQYPHLSSRRYVAEDPYGNLHNSDIVVTTVQSGGTAEDVANLKTVIMTNSLDSPQSNTQVLGRLRRNDTMPQRFAYLVCLDVEKQVQYHSSKKELLAQRAKNYNELFMPLGL